MGRKQRYTAADIIDALKKTKGMVYLAAKELGCSHTTIYNYMKRYVSVREEHEYQRGELLDIAELKLREAVMTGQPWALQFALRCLGKDRGYTERTEVTGAEGGAMVIKYTGNVDPRDI
jgi:hypothetical protein